MDLYLWGVERKEQIAGIHLGWTGWADQSLQSPMSPPRSFSGFCAPPHLNCSLHGCHTAAPPLPDLPSLLSSAPWRGKLLQTTKMTSNVFWSTGHRLLDAWRPSEKLLKNHNMLRSVTDLTMSPQNVLIMWNSSNQIHGWLLWNGNVTPQRLPGGCLNKTRALHLENFQEVLGSCVL